MKKSWFVAIVIFLTLLLLGIGLYFFFPSFKKITDTVIPGDSPLFGTITDTEGTNNQNNTNNTSPTTPITPTPEAPIEGEIRYKAFKIGDYSVSSVQPIDFKTGTTSTTTLLLSVGKGSGVVRLYDPQTEVTSIIGSISVPNIITSEFTQDGTYVVVQSQEVDTLKTMVLKSTPRTPTEERFFSPIYSSSNTTNFFVEKNTIYFVEKIQSGSELYEYVPSTNKKTLLYRGLFSDIYGYARGGDVFIGTKPASNTQGFIFKLNKELSLLEKITSGSSLVGIPSLNGEVLLTTEYFNSGARTNLINVDSKDSTYISINTFKEKCVPKTSTRTFIFCGAPQSLKENSPDSWYMGKVNNNDKLYLIDSESGSLSILTTTDEFVDVLNPHSSQYSGILTFINKNNSNPWIIILK